MLYNILQDEYTSYLNISIDSCNEGSPVTISIVSIQIYFNVLIHSGVSSDMLVH